VAAVVSAVSTTSSPAISRSFQNVVLFDELSVLDNLLVGADHIARPGLLTNLFRLPKARRHNREAHRRAERVLEFLGISPAGLNDVPATDPAKNNAAYEAGRIAMSGPSDELRRSQVVQAAYLGGAVDVADASA